MVFPWFSKYSLDMAKTLKFGALNEDRTHYRVVTDLSSQACHNQLPTFSMYSFDVVQSQKYGEPTEYQIQYLLLTDLARQIC